MKTLLVAPAWVGDMVMAHALIRELAAQDPELQLELVAPPATAALAERMPHVRRVHLLDVPHGRFGFGARLGLGRSLRGAGFERAFVLPNSWKSALVPLLAGITQRIGYVGEFRHGLLTDARELDRARLPRMVDRFIALARCESDANAQVPEGAPAPAMNSAASLELRPELRRDPDAARQLRQARGLMAQRPVLACCPGAEFGEAKRWPARHFARLIEDRVAAGWQVWLFGSAADCDGAGEIVASLSAAALPWVQDLAGATRLTEAVDLLGEAHAVVSNDSGLMHVGAALGVPVVGIYGSTSSAFTPPLGERVETVALGLACAPCFQRSCPLGHRDCLEKLEPDRVLAALETVLAGPAGSPGATPGAPGTAADDRVKLLP